MSLIKEKSAMKKSLVAVLMVAMPALAQHVATPIAGNPPPPPPPPLVVGPVRVQVPPPPPRAEVQPVAPSARHIWIAGHWAWRGGAHVWLSGAWVVPPESNVIWEPARWANEGGEWRFFEGHWRPVAPPAPDVF